RKEHLHFLGPVLNSRRNPLDRHQREWWPTKTFAPLRPGPNRVSELQAGNRRDPDESTIDPGTPALGIRDLVALKPDQSRLVDEPVRHRQAPAMTSGSARSAKISPERFQSSSVVFIIGRGASPSSRRRRYSFRDRPSSRALRSIRATVSSLSPRISTFVTATTFAD